MTESAEQIAERIITANSDWPASAFPKTVADIAAALTAAHQERDAAIRRAESHEQAHQALAEANRRLTERAEQAEADAAALREALELCRRNDAMLASVRRDVDAVLASTPAASIAALEKRVMLECAEVADKYDEGCEAAAEIRKLAEEKE